ncbi:methyltransferase, TIGR04325 family [Chitinophaga varians]|uniref:Methyltransferase, TIGR04325 family n=1 Tax=Chitinophaga varians TaxID=2202339 RepID=A0A847RUI3_9BACT|nr:methyltransferase, TIGR04325 family [Chitinophaga varians]NLR63021.1 methyltransferase, TIGR04325 family [Chitinophaga varians]
MQVLKLLTYTARHYKLLPERTYTTYDEALKACHSAAYHDNDIIDTVANKGAGLETEMTTTTVPDVNPGIMALLSAVYQVLLVSPGKQVSIIDYGGGEGKYYYHLRKTLPSFVRLLWTIVETPGMTAAMKPFQTAELRFVSSLEDVPPADIVFTSGAYQYTASPGQTLLALKARDADFMIFNRQSLSLEPFDIISIQTSKLSHHGHGKVGSGFREKLVSYPHTSIRQEQFEALLTDKYDVLYTYQEASGMKQVNRYKVAGTNYFMVKKGDGILPAIAERQQAVVRQQPL